MVHRTGIKRVTADALSRLKAIAAKTIPFELRIYSRQHNPRVRRMCALDGISIFRDHSRAEISLCFFYLLPLLVSGYHGQWEGRNLDTCRSYSFKVYYFGLSHRFEDVHQFKNPTERLYRHGICPSFPFTWCIPVSHTPNIAPFAYFISAITPY